VVESRPTSDPAVDVFASPEDIVVVIGPPGFNQDQFDLQAADQSLLITAERPLTDTEEGARPLQRERLNNIERLLELQAAVDRQGAIATCETASVLTVFQKRNQHAVRIAFE